MFTKINLVAVASALLALTIGAGCANVGGEEGTSESESEPTPAQSDAMIAEVQEQGATPATFTSIKPSPVTCTGDQNNGGRICCDATHCCINILGVINCSLPPRTQQLTTYQISR